MKEKLKIAVLIDSENAEKSIIEEMFAEISKYGKPTIKRAYGDWSKENLKGWKSVINDYAIKAVQKFAHTKGKNSTDTALIIDALDILHSRKVDGFCIISSDSDYTGLALRIREEGLFVMGIGKLQTPKSLVNACEVFVYTEILKSNLKPEKNIIKGPKIIGKINLEDIENKLTKKKINSDLIDKAFDNICDESDCVFASRFKEAIISLDPSFDHRVYGFSSFRKFLEALSPRYKIKIHEDGTTISICRDETEI